MPAVLSALSMAVEKILVVDDEEDLLELIEYNLGKEGYRVTCVASGEEAIHEAKQTLPDLVLLDLLLPSVDGLDVCKTLKADPKTQHIPIIMLTAKSEEADVVTGLELGADDYLTKPFHKDELVARIHAIVRRSKGHAQSVIATGDLIVNLDQKTVEVTGARVHLTGKEYQMLELLSLRKGTTLTKEMFLNHLYGGMDEPELKIIDVFICKLRKKLANASHGRNYIETVWGRGYVLREPLDDEERITA